MFLNNIKNFSNIFKKLVYALILFALFFFINTTVYAVSITFNSHGGSDVSNITRDIDEELGNLDSPTREGYIFDGWYKESSYTNKVSARTIVKGAMELHAKWVINNFPYVYGPYNEEFTCTGSNYIDTDVPLYTNTNWQKDYEIGFTITEYDPDIQTRQAVFVNAKSENKNNKWPGIVFRRFDATDTLELTQSINMGLKEQAFIENYTLPLKIKILRIDKKIYYEFADGERTLFQDMSDFNQQFSVDTYFCAGDNGSGGTQRYLKGKITDYYIKMGTYEDEMTHTVTYADGTVEVVNHNEIVNLGTNNEDKSSEEAEVTFILHNGEQDVIDYTQKTYTRNGFKSGNIHYDDESTVVVTNDITIQYDYTEEIIGVVFPSDPERQYYVFDGWWTQEDGGTQVNEYSNIEDLELHAHWILDITDDLESNTYEVEVSGNDRIVIGFEESTTIGDFKTAMANPNEFIKVYDSNNNELTNNEIVKTGLIVKLIIDGTVYDEATIVVRGDIDGDGIVNISDLMTVKNHLQNIEQINDNIKYNAANVEQDNAIRTSDFDMLNDYLKELLVSLNN